MRELHWDFETLSACDLKRAGLHNYARHATTDIWVGAYAFDDEPVEIWIPGEPLPTTVKNHIETGGIFWGHNVAFEYEIWNECATKKHGFPPLKIEQCFCSMALAYSMALPGSLENVAPALGITTVKDMAGSRIMTQLCKPKEIIESGCRVCGGDGTDDGLTACEMCGGTGAHYEWHTDAIKIQRLYEYCKQDVEVERALVKRLMMLSSRERGVWLLDQKINARGVRIDYSKVLAAIDLVEEEKARLDKEMRQLTKNEVVTCSANGQLTSWLNDMGVETDSVAAVKVLELLDQEIPTVCRQVLLLRKEANKSSTAKLTMMRDGAGKDMRMRGLFQYHGAATGRWSGRRVQLQNLPRPSLDQSDIEEVFKLLDNDNAAEMISMMFCPPLSAISDCLRGFLVPAEGHDFIAADLASIEARMLAWLAGEESTLQIFRGHGKIYEFEAAGIYGTTISNVTKDQRQIGKVAVLSLGYGGGKGAFQQMAKNYGVKVTDERAEEIKIAWRNTHPNIVRYWFDLEDAAIEATLNPLSTVLAGPSYQSHRQVKFKRSGSFLWARLPSGRVLCYPYPKIEEVTTPWGDKKEALTFMAQDAVTNRWCKETTYGGKLAENITQAASRDILVDCMFGLEKVGYPVVMHVHDEVVCEVPEDFGSVKEMEAIMTRVPAWASGLPLGAEAWRGKRYRK